MGRVGQCILDTPPRGCKLLESFQGWVDVHPALQQLTYTTGKWWFPIIVGWAQHKEHHTAPISTSYPEATENAIRPGCASLSQSARHHCNTLRILQSRPFWCQASSSEAKVAQGNFFPWLLAGGRLTGGAKAPCPLVRMIITHDIWTASAESQFSREKPWFACMCTLASYSCSLF